MRFSIHFFFIRRCLPGSLNKSNLDELLEKSEECLYETRKMFRKKYIEHKFKVSGPWVENERDAIKSDVINVNLKTFKAIMDVLQHFGDLVRMFEIDFEDINIDEAREIVKHVNDKSFNLLKWFGLLNCKGNILNGLNRSFSLVSHMMFSSSETSKLIITEKHKKLNELVPNLVSFSVKHTKPSDWKFIDGSLPKLSHLNIDLSKYTEQDNGDYSHMSELFKGDHITTLGIESANLKFLKLVSKHLPKLLLLNVNGLSKDYFNYHGDRVQFDYVNLLSIIDHDDKLPENMFINEVDDFRLNIKSQFTVKWLDFISTQTNSKSFTLLTKNLPIEQFLAIPEKLPLIQSVYIESESNVTAEDVVNFLKKTKNNKLTSLRMDVGMNELEQKKLRKTIPEEFTVEFENGKNTKFTFKR